MLALYASRGSQISAALLSLALTGCGSSNSGSIESGAGTAGGSGEAGASATGGVAGEGGAGQAGQGGAGAAGSAGIAGDGGASGSSGSAGVGGSAGAAGSAGGGGTSGAGGVGGTAGVGGTGGFSGTGGTTPVDCSVNGAPGTCIDVSECIAPNTASPGFCPGPANIQCCTATTTTTCDPTASPLPNEGLVEEAGMGGCPPGMAPSGTFCVDRWEASLVFIADGSSHSPFQNPGTASVRAVSIGGAIPQAYINGVQAAAACEASGKRLCTDTEWLRACEGPMGTTYPYGDTKEPGVCNDARAVHPAVEYFGTNASWIWSELGNACIDQLPDSLDPTGSRQGCVTADGMFDMMGNLHEWTADPAGTFRGGFYVDTVLNGPGCLYATTAHDTSHWDYSTGFRCCADHP